MNSASARWADLPVSDDLAELDPASISPGDCAKPIGFDDPMCRLISPDDGKPLVRKERAYVSSNGVSFPIDGDRPILLPRRAIDCIKGNAIEVPVEKANDAFLQYLYLNAIKGSSGEINTPHGDVWYHRHLHRARRLLSDASGLVVDVGCDDPKLSRTVVPRGASYIGLDPVLGARSEPSLVAMAEFLPFADGSVDNVVFLTSLDHILDHHLAVDEAFRVLRPGGRLYMASLVWTQRATLLTDNIHFHHFRQYEIEGVLGAFRIDHVTRYNWKNNDHRLAIYLAATKP
ncbi:MAG: class I SAM-dependent methyltransferase [Bacteroidota bacterium]|nr:class I SAM-dependent methyltransferase [Bacteroidota bacterium]